MTLQEFEKIFIDNYKTLCQYCLKFVKEPSQAEEIVQELFIALWEKKTDLSLINNIEAYLTMSVRTELLTFCNRNLTRPALQN